MPGQTCWTPPALANGRLLVRGNRTAACVFVGPPGKRPAPVSGTDADRPAIREGWAARYVDRSAYEPGPADLFRWFLYILTGVFGTASLAAWAGGAPFKRRLVIFGATSVLVGITGVPLFSMAAGRFVFTWPAVMYTAYVGLLLTAVGARHGKGGLRPKHARLALVGFIGLILFYCAVCRALGIASGIGFAFGLLIAWPATVPLVRRLWERRAGWTTLGLGGASFTLYFWSSALLVIFKTAG